MPKVITVTMNPALDMIVELSALTPYAVNKARGDRLYCGGKGINVSLVLALLGVETVACGFLGRENVEPFTAFCRENRIQFGFRMLGGRTRTNVKLAVDDHPATDINLPGLPVSGEDLKRLAEDLDERAGPDSLFVLSGSLPPGAPAEAYATLIARLRAKGARVYVDASGPALARALDAKPNLAKPNHHEILDLEPGADESLEAIVRAAEKRAGPDMALSVSLGSRGALWCSTTECLHVPPAPVKAINLVGAGDTFLAGLVYGELEGWSAVRRLAFANAVAGHWVEKMERTRLDRDRVDQLAAATLVAPVTAAGPLDK